MRGYQLTFFTQQDRRHEGKPLGEWLMQLAKRLGLQGATMVSATEGFGPSGRVHSARFFELGDQPIEVLMTVSEAQADRLFEHLRDAGVHLFYVKTAVEYGTLGGE